MGCIWFVFKGQSYSVQAFQTTKDALVRGITCVQNALRQFEKASRHSHLLNVTVSYSPSLTYVLAMYLFVYSNSNDHSCCFRVFHIARTFQACCKGIIHKQPAIAEKLEEEEKKEKCYLTTKVLTQCFRALLSKIPHLCLHACTLRTMPRFCKQSCSHCLRFHLLVIEKYFETLRREMVQYSKYLPNLLWSEVILPSQAERSKI